ncbi:hypothetical protein LOK49_LG01G01223 [Camellia lanceoleosa]|uniref:Uncharacterized protein n=1 Tax=Camellia lanceoleosa TaxID=1840588 RepID=A0ACC0IV16_9ERIC|nr:hypothetical protein LOK49_LG01G01223 [Camellia lanceoleosa]
MDGDGGSAIATVGSIDLSRGGNLTAVVDLTGQVHQLPCCVKYDGSCSVAHYFKPKPTGTSLSLSLSIYIYMCVCVCVFMFIYGLYCCFVLGKKSADKRKTSDKCEENSNCWEMNANFQSITFWNHDNLPSQDDAFLRSLHWLTVANALHQPVTAEDLESASTTQEN